MLKLVELDSATAVLELYGHFGQANMVAASDNSGVPYSTLWHRDHGRVTRKVANIAKQYLTVAEETALVNYFLRMSANGYPLPVKFARSLAHVIALKRTSIFVASNEDHMDSNQPKLPSKN